MFDTSINTLLVSGVIAETPRAMNSKYPMCKFRIVYSKTYIGKDKQPHTFNMGFNVKAVNDACAGILGHFDKGDAVIITGGISTESWTDEESKKRYDTLIDLKGIVKIGTAPIPGQPPEAHHAYAQRPQPPELQPDDLPPTPVPPKPAPTVQPPVPTDLNMGSLDGHMLTPEADPPF